MSDETSRFIDFLVSSGAFKLGTFTLKSGRSSPTFVNTGLIKDGRGMRHLGAAFAARLLDELGAEGFDCIFGPAYKGIPLAVATAMALDERGVVKPWLFDRKERKDHGEEASSRGAASVLVGHRPEAGERIAMVDDVLTDGATKVEAVALLRSLVPDARFPALLVAVDRQEVRPDGTDAVAAFTADTGMPVFPAVRMTDLLDHLRAGGKLPPDELTRCREYLGRYGTPVAKEWAERV